MIARKLAWAKAVFLFAVRGENARHIRKSGSYPNFRVSFLSIFSLAALLTVLIYDLSIEAQHRHCPRISA